MSTYLSLFSLSFTFFLFFGLLRQQSSLLSRLSFFDWLSLGLIVWPRLGDPFVSQNSEEICASFPGKVLGCAYTICSYGQISISCTFPSGSSCSSSHVYSYSLITQSCLFFLSLLDAWVSWEVISACNISLGIIEKGIHDFSNFCLAF